MSIEIVAIGNEVLRGMVVNTNCAYISRRLEKEGWDVARHTILPDSPQILAEGLKESLKRSSAVITTGGLGPTLDDMTFACAKTLFSSPPALLKNTVGSASGYYFKKGSSALFLLPGVPPEMEAMFEQEVIPLLKQILPVKRIRHELQLHFSMLKETEADPLLRKLQKELSIEIGIYPSYIKSLAIILRGYDLSGLEKAKQILKQAFPSHYYESSNGKIEEAIQRWMIEHHKTLACAESCTGGAIAARLVSFPGASSYFLGSIVTYSNGLKEKLLHVSPHTLKTKGAVSQETVYEMWKGLLEATGADFGIAVSGIAGPMGGTSTRPVGVVEYAIGFKNKDPETGSLHLKGSREIVILGAVHKILSLVWRQITSSK